MAADHLKSLLLFHLSLWNISLTFLCLVMHLIRYLYLSYIFNVLLLVVVVVVLSGEGCFRISSRLYCQTGKSLEFHLFLCISCTTMARSLNLYRPSFLRYEIETIILRPWGYYEDFDIINITYLATMHGTQE